MKTMAVPRRTAAAAQAAPALPSDVVAGLLGRLQLRDRFTAGLVCKSWREAAVAATTAVSIGWRSASIDPWLAAHHTHLTQLVVSYSFSPLTEQLPALTKLPCMQQLRVLRLCPLQLPADTLSGLSKLTRLPQLNLNKVTAAGASVDSLPLALKHLTALTNLQFANYSDQQASALAAALPCLKHLRALNVSSGAACSGKVLSGLQQSGLSSLTLAMSPPGRGYNLKLAWHEQGAAGGQGQHAAAAAASAALVEPDAAQSSEQEQQQQQSVRAQRFSKGLKGLLQWLRQQEGLERLTLNINKSAKPGRAPLGGPSAWQKELADLDEELEEPADPEQPQVLQLYSGLVHSSLVHLQIGGLLPAAAGRHMFGGLAEGALSRLTHLSLSSDSEDEDEWVGYRNPYLTPPDVAALGRACIGAPLKTLVLSGSANEHAGVGAFSHLASSLTSLSLGGCGVAGLAALTGLQDLRMDCVHLGVLDVAAMAKHLTRLTYFIVTAPVDCWPRELNVLQPDGVDGYRGWVCLIELDDAEESELWGGPCSDDDEGEQDDYPMPPLHQRLADRVPEEVWQCLAAQEAAGAG